MKTKLGGIIDNLKKGLKAPTRHHNPYLNEALLLSEVLYTEQELLKTNGKLFQNSNPIVVEIGCYMGKNVAELAQQNKNINFMGLDITYKRVVKAAKKLKQNKIDNAKIALCDGTLFLDKLISSHSLQGVCVFFPDPWPKDKHQKNRLLNANFVNLLKEKLSPEGFFWFKTDAQGYFQQTEKLLLESGFILDNECDDNGLNKPKCLQGGPYETAFQKIFTSKQVPFYQGVYRHKG